METVTLTIDGLAVTVATGATILQAALENDIYIPNLCSHPDLEPVGVCRLCMVEVDGRSGMTVACKTPVEEDMVVRTDSEPIRHARRVTAELLIANSHSECLICGKNSDCELQRVANYVGANRERLDRLRRPAEAPPVDDSNPFFFRDLAKCVLCGICVRTCSEILGVGAIDFSLRGFDTTISTFGDRPLKDSRCVSCGECVARCPVGALIPKKAEKPSREVKTVCGYCGCGCGLFLGVRGDRIVGARGDRDNPASKGNLCVKGRFGHEFVNSPERLTVPLVRRDGELQEATWAEALDLVAEKFGRGPLVKKLNKSCAGSFATIASAKCTNEENYLLQKFARSVMGTNNIDHCARICHSPTVAGLAAAFGSGAMTNSMAEVADAACILAIGTNTTVAHPIIALEIVKAKRRGAKLIVANPREIELCRMADVFLQHRPGTDVALLMGMMKVIVDEGLLDKAFIENRCENFDGFGESLQPFDLDFAEHTTGVQRNDLVTAARIYASEKPASILYAMGITQHTHGTDNVSATANLALLTGNVGRASSGVNPLRGQNNVQGACDMGALPNVFPGYQKVADSELREKFEEAWGVALPTEPGLTLLEIFDAACEGKIKAIYLVGENPVLSDADASHVEEAIRNLEFFVVQDIFLTETAKMADVVLPGASFAEKDGTFTNTERRVQRVRKAIEPVGDARPDWWITCQLARRLGAEGFEFERPAEIMAEIASLTPSYGGLSYERIDQGGPQWPCPAPSHGGTMFLHKDKFPTGSGKASFTPLQYRPPAESPDSDYPLILTTGRSLYHFHTGSMTRQVEGLNEMRRHELVEINPRDAKALGIADGEKVRVVSRRGAVSAEARVTTVSPPGVIFMTFHFHESPTNRLTNAARDPQAKTPETKVCAVRVERLGGE
jgi:formate dehydrogenase alpha subunit